jgi:glutamine synthetase
MIDFGQNEARRLSDDVCARIVDRSTFMTEATLAHRSAHDVDRVVRDLDGGGVRTVIGTYVDNAGVFRAKQVPVSKTGSFHSPGLGAAPSWAVFAIDDLLVLNASFTVVGDMRLRVDLDAIKNLGGGVAWAPVELADQQGSPLDHCARGVLRRQQAGIEAEGIEALAAFEIEFTCFDLETGLVGGGPAYGLGPLLDREKFLDDVLESFAFVGLKIEQLHAEYGLGQIELTTEPAAPLQAVDNYVLARVVLGRVARTHGMKLSFSPKPVFNGIGNGAHLHISFSRRGEPFFSGGEGPHGLTDEGGAVIGGLVKWLPESIGVLAPSLLSSTRLLPGHWSGAFACWGLENREAALRLCEATPGNPRGANLEIKCVDHSANPYSAAALILGLSRRGREEKIELPDEVPMDPGTLSEDERASRNIVAIGGDQISIVAALNSSQAVRGVLGDVLVDAMVAVRGHEVEMAKSLTEEELIEKFRYVWSA